MAFVVVVYACNQLFAVVWDVERLRLQRRLRSVVRRAVRVQVVAEAASTTLLLLRLLAHLCASDLYQFVGEKSG